MGSGAMIYVPSFIKIGSAIQKLIGGMHRHRGSMEIAQAYFHFFKNFTLSRVLVTIDGFWIGNWIY
jgi:hypothetical protein